jgi:catechol 2,3-dioxygenase-like lactoylglutathione lyase family enzyme
MHHLERTREVNDGVSDWFARPVLFVADIDRTLEFYVKRLGFAQSWRHADCGKAIVAQVERDGCTLLFSSQWPEKAGKGLMFISPNVHVERAEDRPAAETALLDRLRAEFSGKGVAVEEGRWGFPILIVRDPDGNELFFNYPAD